MQIDTYLFGQINVAEDAILSFPLGLPGFEQCTRFALIYEEGKQEVSASYTLQALDDPHVAFQISDPTDYGFHYELELSSEETTTLEVVEPSDIVVMLVLFRRDDKVGPIEPNLRAPLLINTKMRLGMQKTIARIVPNLTLSNLSRSVK